MKKLLIAGIMLWSLVGCKKAEIEPDTLSNTFWTGFFIYDGVKQAGLYSPLKQAFGMEFLSGGEFRFYEAVGVSAGKWTLNQDKTITVNQDNKNVITFQYDAQSQGITFLKMQGSPAPWRALEIEQYTTKEAISNIENVTWNDGVAFPITVKLEPTPRVDGYQYSLPATFKNNLIWVKKQLGASVSHFLYMYRAKEDLLWGTAIFNDNTGTIYPHRRR